MESFVPFLVFGILIAIFGVTGFLVIRAIRGQQNAAIQASRHGAEFEERRRAAVWAGATVITLHRSTYPDETRAEVRADLLLQVRPPTGDPYNAKTSWMVSVDALAGLQPGSEISIKIDREDPQIIYPNVGNAKFIPK